MLDYKFEYHNCISKLYTVAIQKSSKCGKKTLLKVHNIWVICCIFMDLCTLSLHGSPFFAGLWRFISHWENFKHFYDYPQYISIVFLSGCFWVIWLTILMAPYLTWNSINQSNIVSTCSLMFLLKSEQFIHFATILNN